MVKLLAMVAVLFSTSWYGFYFAKRVSERPKQIRILKNALQSLEAEILFSQLPLPEACEKISTQFTGPLSQMFRSFSTYLRSGRMTVNEAWKQVIEEMKGNSALKENEIEILLQFGETLGLHDSLSQQKQITLTMKHLERMEIEAVEAQQQYEKMWKTMGVLVGLFIIILLV